MVSLETDTDLTNSAMHMIKEEQVTVLLCFHITCLSLVQKYDKKNGIIITDAHEFQKAVLYSKT